MTIIEDGARFHGLNPQYQNWLSTLPRYTGPKGLSQGLGKIFYLVLLAMVLSPLFFIYLGSRYLLKRKQMPRIVAVSLIIVQPYAWSIYRGVFIPVFGDSCTSLFLNPK